MVVCWLICYNFVYTISLFSLDGVTLNFSIFCHFQISDLKQSYHQGQGGIWGLNYDVILLACSNFQFECYYPWQKLISWFWIINYVTQEKVTPTSTVSSRRIVWLGYTFQIYVEWLQTYIYYWPKVILLIKLLQSRFLDNRSWPIYLLDWVSLVEWIQSVIHVQYYQRLENINLSRYYVNKVKVTGLHISSE